VTGLSRTVLIVEDEFLISLNFKALVEDMGLHVCAIAESAADAIGAAQRHRPAVVLMDVRLKGNKDGVDAALQIYDLMQSKVIFITGSREQATLDRINSDHPFAILFKPVDDDVLKTTIKRALDTCS
jgi:DNA-binding NarL/FixJ family response regulator